LFADPVVATAILDRLLNQSLLTIRGDSYRLPPSERAALSSRPPVTGLR
jgi:hypothetical protein